MKTSVKHFGLAVGLEPKWP